MKQLLAAAGKFTDVELARIKKETAERVLVAQNKYVAEKSAKPGVFVQAMRSAYEDEIRQHGEAAWRALHDILESSPRHYYREREVDEVRSWVKSRFGGSADGLVQSLIHEARRFAIRNEAMFDRSKRELETAVIKARERAEAEVEKYFSTRRDWLRGLLQFTQHPVISYVLIALLAFAAGLVIPRCN